MDERELQALVDVAAAGALRELERHAGISRQGRRDVEDALEREFRKLVSDGRLWKEDDS